LKGLQTLEQWQVYHQNQFDEQEAREAIEALKVTEEAAEREALLLGLADLYDLMAGSGE
jgi:hypothetical protein